MKKVGIALGVIVAVLVLLAALGGREPSSQALAAEIGASIDTETFTREDLRFPCGEPERETTCAGWLYTPKGVESPPVVIMGHGMSGVREDGLPFFAETFAANGIAALVFDYRYFGDSGGTPRNLVDPDHQINDWMSAIALVRGLEKVDAERLALWGTSMSGGLVLAVAGEDPGVDAIISQIPGLDSEAEREGLKVDGASLARLFSAIAMDHVQSIFSDEAFVIRTFGEDGDYAMFSDAQTLIDAEPMKQEGKPVKVVAGRSLPRLSAFNPRVYWDGVKVPTLVMASDTDRLSPIAPIEEFAEYKKDYVTLEKFEGTHFSPYLQPVMTWASQRQADFLKEVFALDEPQEPLGAL